MGIYAWIYKFWNQFAGNFEISGVDSISIDPKDNKLTVTGGDFDIVCLLSKLRKLCHADIITLGPAKVEEKKKDEPKKEGGDKKDDVADLVKAYKAYNPCMTAHYYVYSAEEDANACVIC